MESRKVDCSIDNLGSLEYHKILSAFLGLLYEHDTGIYSLGDSPINLDLSIIGLIPNDIVQEYESIRLRYEESLRELIKKVEKLPVNPF
ncbi:hypothetical protein EA438_05815 [Streptococcus dysgalactiae subsp. dysgalactiae]|nr:hypothetical protein [Streptococcus dysgalactiae subsp. dysgalactiae]